MMYIFNPNKAKQILIINKQIKILVLKMKKQFLRINMKIRNKLLKNLFKKIKAIKI